MAGGRDRRGGTGDDADAGKRRFGARPLDPERAWEYLLRLLSQRAYTAFELEAKLARRGILGAEAGALLRRLEELRLIDDATYAERYVASRRAGRGRLALRQELRRKGVAVDVVERELRDLDHDDQVAAAVDLLRRNAWRYRPASPSAQDATVREAEARANRAKARGKAMAFLARRGFPADAAIEAIERLAWFADDA